MNRISELKIILANKKYEYDIKGKCEKLANLLGFEDQRKLAVRFAKKVLFILKEHYPKTLSEEYINEANVFVNDKGSLHNLKLLYVLLKNEFITEFRFVGDYQYNAFNEVHSVISLLTLFFHPIRVIAHMKKVKYDVYLHEIIDAIYTTFYFYYAGKENMRSKDKAVVKEAKARGKEAAYQELRWQLDQIYQVFKDRYDIDIWAMEKEIRDL